MTNPMRNTAPAVKYRVGSLGELCLVTDIRDFEHLYELRTLTGVEWYDAAGNWTEPPTILPDRLPVPRGSSPGPLHLTDEEVRMVTQPADGAEVKVIDADHVEIYLPAGATLPPEYVGWTGEQSDWDPPSGEQRLHLVRPQATPAPTGHVRLAWLALVLLLAAPFLAVADPPPAPDAGTPDAGTVTPRQPTHWERWPAGGPPGGAGDEPSPSTGDKAG